MLHLVRAIVGVLADVLRLGVLFLRSSNAVRLCEEKQLFPVCSPRLMGGRGRKARPSDLLRIPLLHLDSRKDWSK